MIFRNILKYLHNIWRNLNSFARSVFWFSHRFSVASFFRVSRNDRLTDISGRNYLSSAAPCIYAPLVKSRLREFSIFSAAILHSTQKKKQRKRENEFCARGMTRRVRAFARLFAPTRPGYEYAFSFVKYVQIASRYSGRPFIIVGSSYSPSRQPRRDSKSVSVRWSKFRRAISVRMTIAECVTFLLVLFAISDILFSSFYVTRT